MPRNSAEIAIEEGVATITLDGPPLNALDRPLREALHGALTRVLRDDAVRAVVLCGAGEAFAGSPDLRDPEPLSAEPSLAAIGWMIEKADKPVAAVLKGLVLGAGAALALACHYRVAEAGARIGFPEVGLGQLPEGGATQRLPRLVGMEAATSLMVRGKVMEASAQALPGLVEAEAKAGEGVEVARDYVMARGETRPVLSLPVATPEAARDHLAVLRARLGSVDPDGPEAVRLAACEALEASLGPVRQGLALEERLARDTLTSVASQGLRHVTRAAHRLSGGRDRIKGAASVVIMGTNGPGIEVAIAALRTGSEVGICDPKGAEVQDKITRTLQGLHEKGRFGAEKLAQFQGRLKVMTLTEAMDWADLVVEAGTDTESIGRILSQTQAKGDAAPPVMLTCSYAYARTLPEPSAKPHGIAWVSAAQSSGHDRIWECRALSGGYNPRAFEVMMDFARRLRRVPLWSEPSTPPLVPRLAAALWQAADHLLEAGAKASAVDSALEGYGFATGPFAAQDAAGLDRVRDRWAEVSAPQSRDVPIAPALEKAGLTGRAVGHGYLVYGTDGKPAGDSPAAVDIVEGLRRERNIAARDVPADEIVAYCVTALQNIGARMLEEPGISAEMVDLAALHLTGFPRWRGGPLFAADQEGAGQVLSRVWRYGTDDPVFWAPAPRLETAVFEMRPIA